MAEFKGKQKDGKGKGKKLKEGVEDSFVQPFRAPVLDFGRMVDIERVAHLHADAHRSDPFARRRITLYMRRGMELPSDVATDAKRFLDARAAELARRNEASAPVTEAA